MNKLLIVALIALVACSEKATFKKFKQFIKKYNKNYRSMEEFMARYQVFKHNLLYTFKQHKSYKNGITKFSDMTKQEFAKKYLNLNYDAMATVNFQETVIRSNDAPEAFDWRDQGRVSPVKDQKSCGSCYAFSAIANLEGLYYAEKKTMVTMSEQQIVDCDTLDGGCNGGLMEYTFTWIKQNGGIQNDDDYPYKGRKYTCSQDTTKFVDMQVTGYEKLGSSTEWDPVDEVEVKEFLYKTGPLAIALNANPLQTYSSGVLDLDESECDPDGMNHAVTLVGYGHDTETDLDYWLVKNSWGLDWGEDGYFRMARGKGTCGINRYVMTATVSF